MKVAGVPKKVRPRSFVEQRLRVSLVPNPNLSVISGLLTQSQVGFPATARKDNRDCKYLANQAKQVNHKYASGLGRIEKMIS